MNPFKDVKEIWWNQSHDRANHRCACSDLKQDQCNPFTCFISYLTNISKNLLPHGSSFYIIHNTSFAFLLGGRCFSGKKKGGY